MPYTYIMMPQSLVTTELVDQAVETSMTTLRPVSIEATPRVLLKFSGTVPPDFSAYTQYDKAFTQTEIDKPEWQPTEIITNGVVAWWNFREGYNTLSLGDIQSGNDGTIIGATAGEFWTAGIGKGTFDQINDYVNCGSPAELVDLPQKTLELWFYPTGYGSFGRILTKNNSVANGWELSLSGGVSNWVGFIQSHDILHGQWHTETDTIALDTLYHFAMTYDSGSLSNVPTFYLNGVLSPYVVRRVPNGNLTSDAGLDMYIGARQISGAPSQYFDGEIRTIRIYSRMLTQVEVLHNYNEELAAMS